ncbi:tripartite tricarboxylate transporter substrate binding protein [Alcaligenaceae bacterium LF4-65]|uniref:Tripartite tricarboxylate transporter substrate binding protein n=1 Tax=Zwartia hollandica TaxID=324606 RepID=A0A953T4N7_9BURK|nr:tripartite tricarboxylate transporter substrate binding protein [Zwartia hollandica]MBZ1350032.1 tripartite tricarboxylate transporter substrate binding protein [Zwartia hollandica]
MKKLVLSACLAFTAALPLTASAQSATYPTQPIKMLIGFAAGGPTDVIGRILAQHMTATMGQSVVVENRTGANSLIATREVAKAKPDGYTVLFASLSHNVNRLLLNEKAEYEPLGSFAPVSLVANLPLVVVTAYDAPYKTLQDLIAAAKSKPEAVSYGSAGNGGSAHLAGALMATMTDTKMVHVPFRGNAPALTEVMAGRVSFMFYPMIGIAGHVADKRLRVLAVGSSKPMPDFPGVPTMDASGFPDFEQTAPWVGMLAPAGTPKAIVDQLNAALKKALAQPEIIKRMKDLGASPIGDTPEEFRAFLVKDSERWARVIKASGIKAD